MISEVGSQGRDSNRVPSSCKEVIIIWCKCVCVCVSTASYSTRSQVEVIELLCFRDIAMTRYNSKSRHTVATCFRPKGYLSQKNLVSCECTPLDCRFSVEDRIDVTRTLCTRTW